MRNTIAESDFLVGALRDGNTLCKGIIFMELFLDKAAVALAFIAGNEIDAVRVLDVLTGIVSEFFALIDIKAIGGIVAVGVAFIANASKEGSFFLWFAMTDISCGTETRIWTAGVLRDDVDGAGGRGKDLRVICTVVKKVIDDVCSVFSGSKLRRDTIFNRKLFLCVA